MTAAVESSDRRLSPLSGYVSTQAALEGVEGDIRLTLGLNHRFWDTPEDLMLGYTRFGRNELRFLRDQHLHLRIVRVGEGVVRDHVALDLRPWT